MGAKVLERKFAYSAAVIIAQQLTTIIPNILRCKAGLNLNVK